MKRIVISLLCLSLFLSGCGWMGGSYASVVPYAQQDDRYDKGITSVSNYQEMRTAMIQMVEAGEDGRTLSLVDFNSDQVESNLQLAILSVLSGHPLTAYTVENITYDIGSTGGVAAVVLTVHYNHNRSQIKSLRQVNGMTAAKSLITGALDRLEPDVVFQVSDFRSMDFDQFVRDYAQQNPDIIMELPQITESIYPENGATRIVELKFTYETSRDSLKAMQNYVRPRFSSAAMFVSGEENPAVKYEKLYAFLMETSDYTVETSITPTYSLLRHSVGDSKAFASVFAAMCRRAGLDCLIVSGTREGEPWNWNMINFGDRYYHLDLVACSTGSGYRLRCDNEMNGYVWDFTNYPRAESPEPPPPETTEPDSPPETADPEQTETEPPAETTEPQTTEPETTEPETTEPPATEPETQPTEPESQPTEPESTGDASA